MHRIEDKLLAVYTVGMTTQYIYEQIKGLYGIDISADTVSNITNTIIPLVSEWQNRPLEKKHTFVFMDAIHYNFRKYKQVIVKVTYVVIGFNSDRKKEILVL